MHKEGQLEHLREELSSEIQFLQSVSWWLLFKLFHLFPFFSTTQSYTDAVKCA